MLCLCCFPFTSWRTSSLSLKDSRVRVSVSPGNNCGGQCRYFYFSGSMKDPEPGPPSLVKTIG